jgi:hypothetical protein
VLMLKVYLINGTGGEFQDDFEEKLSKHISELESINEWEGFSFECSMDEDISPEKKKAKELLLKLDSKPQVEDTRICFIHKNDVEDLLGVKELHQFENDHFIYFTTQSKSRSEDCEGWIKIDIMLSRIVRELKNSGDHFDVERILSVLFDNEVDKTKDLLNDFLDHITENHLQQFGKYDSDETKSKWIEITEALEIKTNDTINKAIEDITSDLERLSKDSYLEITPKIRDNILMLMKMVSE